MQVMVFVFILSDLEKLRWLLLQVHVSAKPPSEKLPPPPSLCSRHPDHHHFIEGRTSNMARAPAPALQPAQL